MKPAVLLLSIFSASVFASFADAAVESSSWGRIKERLSTSTEPAAKTRRDQ